MDRGIERAIEEPSSNSSVVLYIRLQANPLGNGMNVSIPPAAIG